MTSCLDKTSAIVIKHIYQALNLNTTKHKNPHQWLKVFFKTAKICYHN